MTEPVTQMPPAWWLNLMFGDDRPKPYGLLTPLPPVGERWTRQQRRAAERKVAKESFRDSYRKGLL